MIFALSFDLNYIETYIQSRGLMKIKAIRCRKCRSL